MTVTLNTIWSAGYNLEWVVAMKGYKSLIWTYTLNFSWIYKQRDLISSYLQRSGESVPSGAVKVIISQLNSTQYCFSYSSIHKTTCIWFVSKLQLQLFNKEIVWKTSIWKHKLCKVLHCIWFIIPSSIDWFYLLYIHII